MQEVIPDIYDINPAVINRDRCADLCKPLLLVTAEGILQHVRVQKL